MSDQENKIKGFIPLKFSPLTFQTSTGNQLVNTSKLNLQPSGLQQSDATRQSPGTPRPIMNPPSTRSKLSKPAKVASSSENSMTHSLNFPQSSPRVLFPCPSSASSALFSASNNQQICKPKTKSGPMKPPLQQVQQNTVQMEAEENGQGEAQLQGVFEQIQLLQKSNNYEQLMESFQQTGERLEEFNKDHSALISLLEEFKRISDQQRMSEKGAQSNVLQGREEQVLAQLKIMAEERDDIQQKLNEAIHERDQAILEIERMVQEQAFQRNQYENDISNLTESFNGMLNQRDKLVEKLAEEKSRTQTLFHEMKTWRDESVCNPTSYSSLPSGKQEKRPRVDTPVETDGSLPPAARTANLGLLSSSLNLAFSTGTNSRKIKRGVSKDRKTLN